MALQNKGYINGTSVVKPQIVADPNRVEQDLEKLKKSKQEHVRRNAMRNNKVRSGVVVMIVFMAALAFLTVYRGASIYLLQKQYVDLRQETQLLAGENEALRADIIKLSSIQDMVQRSEELHLVEAPTAYGIHVDLSRNYFAEAQVEPVERPFAEEIMSFIGLRFLGLQ